MTFGRSPALPPLRKRVVAVPGHRLMSGGQSNGLTTYRCECGTVQPPLPPVIAAAKRYEHLEVHMASKTEKLVMAGQPGQHAGRSIYEMLWEEMDAVYGRLMAGEGAVAKGDKHYARGLAYALAVMTNPYEPNIDGVRDEAHERWENGLDDQDRENYGLA